jgi:hypothetical protein
MNAKDEEIARLKQEIADLKATKDSVETFVGKNLELFDGLISCLKKIKNSKGAERYFHVRNARRGSANAGTQQDVFKLNLLVADLIEYKARQNVSVKDLKVRISVDKGSLISFLEKGRVKRPRNS